MNQECPPASPECTGTLLMGNTKAVMASGRIAGDRLVMTAAKLLFLTVNPNNRRKPNTGWFGVLL